MTSDQESQAEEAAVVWEVMTEELGKSEKLLKEEEVMFERVQGELG